LAHSFRAVGLLFIILVPAAALHEAEVTGLTGLLFLIPMSSNFVFFAVPCLLIAGGWFWLADRVEYPPQ
jgi:hypothetical protein